MVAPTRCATLAAAGFANTLKGQFTTLKDQFSTQIASQLSGLGSAVSNLNFGAPERHID